MVNVVEKVQVVENLPKGWKWARLGDVCNTTSGGTPSRGNASYYGGGIPWVKSGELTDGDVFKTSEKITQEGLNNSSAKLFPSGTLLIALYGATVGKLGILQMEAATNQAVCAIFPNELVLKDFLFFHLLSCREDLLEISFGGAQPNISQNIIRDLIIPLPPLPEQKRIVGILSDRLTAIDKARTATETQLKAVKALPAAYLRQVFDSPEAQKWKRKKLGDILELRREVIHPHDNPKGAATFVGLEHIQSSTGICIGSIDVEMSELKGRKPKFHKGDIVYGYLRPYLNKVWLSEFDGLCSVDQYVFSTIPGVVDSDFVAWFMRSPVYLNRAPIGYTPGQLPRIRTEEVLSVEINLPSINQQRQVVKQLAKKLSDTEGIRKSLQFQLNTINQLPAATLRQAFNGEL